MKLVDARPFTEVTEDAFIAGQSISYTGFDGKQYSAKFRSYAQPLPVLTIRCVGLKTKRFFFAEHQARSFFSNLGRDMRDTSFERKPDFITNAKH